MQVLCTVPQALRSCVHQSYWFRGPGFLSVPFLPPLLQVLSPEGRGLMGTPCLGAECFNRSSGFCVHSSAQLLLVMVFSEKLVVRDLGANPSPKALLLHGVHQTFFLGEEPGCQDFSHGK